MVVLFPEEKTASLSLHRPVLYLLHGRTGNHTSWSRYSSIERYVEGKNIIVVMPDADNSYYLDMKYGYDYFTFITEELPKKVHAIFNLSADKKMNFICGLSMGGYGAFKAALTFPERYSIGGSLSGALDLHNRIEEGIEDPFIHKLFLNCLGNTMEIKNSENDLFYLIEKNLSEKRNFPQLYQRCGIDDFLYADNRKFHDFCIQRNITINYNDSPGEHNWDYWDLEIKKFIDWLPLESLAE